MIGFVMHWKFEEYIAGTITRADVMEEWQRRDAFAKRMIERFGYWDNPNYEPLCRFMADFIAAADDDAARALCGRLEAENRWSSSTTGAESEEGQQQ